ncbi:hypothetical protein PsorP6_010471 [Peronosclerospora sorghi]|uniref:Uncharacterized protein n=1 Tax=Peronosclerospora sorghi TaxID=230839 RepID=A0ACC0VUH2_9STRA|nr:hypothetical protein PsorP6_010471 [Peronosclerospora sorghi]
MKLQQIVLLVAAASHFLGDAAARSLKSSPRPTASREEDPEAESMDSEDRMPLNFRNMLKFKSKPEAESSDRLALLAAETSREAATTEEHLTIPEKLRAYCQETGLGKVLNEPDLTDYILTLRAAQPELNGLGDGHALWNTLKRDEIKTMVDGADRSGNNPSIFTDESDRGRVVHYSLRERKVPGSIPGQTKLVGFRK